jgi:hypothetical protein
MPVKMVVAVAVAVAVLVLVAQHIVLLKRLGMVFLSLGIWHKHLKNFQ